MRIDDRTYLDFSDVLIKPKRSTLDSRADVDLFREFKFKNSGKTLKCIPICAANMGTTGTFDMAVALSERGLLTALHKHYPKNELADFFCKYSSLWENIFYTIGVNEKDLEKLNSVRDVINGQARKNPRPFPQLLMVDVANGYQESFVDYVKKIRDKFYWSVICCGNVVSAEMTEQLIIAGADIVKVGIGSGACCLTRKIAGVGLPQLGAIIECADAAHGIGGHIMSDGGINSPADVCKAFGANSDFVMVGSYFSGTDECEGEWKERNGSKYLVHYGMSSKYAQDMFNGGLCNYKASEGRCVEVPYKGKVDDIVQEILGGVASASSYIGAKSIKDFSKCTTFIRVNNTHNRIYENNIIAK